MTLNELQRLAEEAGAAIEEDWLSPYDLMRTPLTHEEDALCIAAMSPDTAKKLIAVARELLALRGKPAWEHIEAEVDAEGLRTALEELK